MLNRPLLRTTMAWVEAAPNHDNQWFAFRKKDEPGTETYCFGTFAILIACPEAELVWDLEVDGDQFAMKVRFPGGAERHIEDQAAEVLGLGRERGAREVFFNACLTKADLRKIVDAVAPA